MYVYMTWPEHTGLSVPSWEICRILPLEVECFHLITKMNRKRQCVTWEIQTCRMSRFVSYVWQMKMSVVSRVLITLNFCWVIRRLHVWCVGSTVYVSNWPHLSRFLYLVYTYLAVILMEQDCLYLFKSVRHAWWWAVFLLVCSLFGYSNLLCL